MAQAILGYCEPGSLARRLRNDRILAAAAAMRSEISNTLRHRLDLDALWRRGFDDAIAELDRERQARAATGLIDSSVDGSLPLPPGLPNSCPFTLDELLTDDFTYDRAVEQLYVRLTSWRPCPKDETS